MVACVLLASLGCADQVAQRKGVAVAGPPLEVVDVELVGLNGRENDGREPIVTVLLRPPAAPGDSPVEAALAALRSQGWRLEPAEAGRWWSWEGARGTSYGRLGPASEFVTGAKAAEGYAPTAFEDQVAREPRELVVFSAEVLP